MKYYYYVIAVILIIFIVYLYNRFFKTAYIAVVEPIIVENPANPVVSVSFTPLTDEERIAYYLGDIRNLEVDQEYLSTSKLYTFNTIKDKYFVWGEHLKQYLRKHNLHNKNLLFDFESGDISSPTNRYALVRNRSVNRQGNVDTKPILMKSMTLGRHWGNVYNKQTDTIPFQEKKNILFWRGATTGEEDRPGNRFDIVKMYYDKYPFIDVGYSGTCQGKEEMYSKYVKGGCDIKTFLEHKFILSLEGNDKDSGINWKLNSDCVVVMPKPRHTSWLMEDKLIPNYHYVLIKDDFSDLLEKYEWMMNHLDECKQIIQNANNYMIQFLDVEREERIELEVVKRYLLKMNPTVTTI